MLTLVGVNVLSKSFCDSAGITGAEAAALIDALHAGENQVLRSLSLGKGAPGAGRYPDALRDPDARLIAAALARNRTITVIDIGGNV